MPEQGSSQRSLTFQTGSLNHCTKAPALTGDRRSHDKLPQASLFEQDKIPSRTGIFFSRAHTLVFYNVNIKNEQGRENIPLELSQITDNDMT